MANEVALEVWRAGQLLMAVLIVVVLVAPLLPDWVRRPAGRLFARLTGFGGRLGLTLLFTGIDALITGALASYHLASLQPRSVADDWFAFLHRANDRLHRTLIY